MGDEITACFAQSYAAAREKFLAAAESAHLDVQSHVHPNRGRDGEVLALDVVRDGPADAASVLLISSGCHGVEGFCGSGIQVALLSDPGWHAMAREADVAVVYLHALNPHGFSWWRRTTLENVDLNRNFHDYTKPLPVNAAYAALHPLLVPAHWPPRWFDHLTLLARVLRRGRRAVQTAISAGQHSHPHGLFFGGHGPTWSNLTLRRVLREHGGHAGRLAWIDLHTGLGPNGVGERIHAGRDDADTVARARRWWGAELTSIDQGSSTSAPLTGTMFNAAYEECPQAEYTGVALEYGTVPMWRVLQALRADQWLEDHPEQWPTRGAQIKQQVRDAFYTDTDDWKHRVVAQAREAAQQALAGLVRN